MGVFSLAITGGQRMSPRHYAATPVQYAAKGLKREGRWPGFGTQTMEAIGRPHFMPAMEELARGAHDFEWASCYGAKRQH